LERCDRSLKSPRDIGDAFASAAYLPRNPDTDTIFGIFHLLGYQFSPRLADIGGARFWRVYPKADYGALNGLAVQGVTCRFVQNCTLSRQARERSLNIS
jgi:hypothetical protein